MKIQLQLRNLHLKNLNYIYNSERILNNKYHFIYYRDIVLPNTKDIKLLKNNIFAIKYYRRLHYFYYIFKFNKNEDILYKQYSRIESYESVPKEYRKYFIINNEIGYNEIDIFMIGKDKYLINNNSKRELYKCEFDENTLKYKINKISLLDLITGYIIKFYLLKNKNNIIITNKGFYINEIDINDNVKCIKKYLFLNEIEFPEEYKGKCDVVEFKNGDFIFNLPKKIICIAKKTYEIKTVINLDEYIFHLSQINNIIYIAHQSYHSYFDLNKIYYIRIKLNKYYYSFYLNEDIFVNIKDYNSCELCDSYENKVIYKWDIENSYYWDKQEFIFLDKKDCIFGIYSNNGNLLTLKIYQLKNK